MVYKRIQIPHSRLSVWLQYAEPSRRLETKPVLRASSLKTPIETNLLCGLSYALLGRALWRRRQGNADGGRHHNASSGDPVVGQLQGTGRRPWDAGGASSVIIKKMRSRNGEKMLDIGSEFFLHICLFLWWLISTCALCCRLFSTLGLNHVSCGGGALARFALRSVLLPVY